jgi:hypothetical protein
MWCRQSVGTVRAGREPLPPRHPATCAHPASRQDCRLHAAPLADDEQGYDHQFLVGEGTHNSRHGASLLSDALRSLWRDGPRA